MAVTVTVWLVETVPAVAENVAVLAPDRTVTEAGTFSAPLLLDNETTVFAATAGVMVTVQVELAPELSEAGLQETPVSVLAGVPTVMVPPFPLAGMLLALGSAAETFVTAMLTAPEAPAETVALTTATTPLAMAVWFNP